MDCNFYYKHKRGVQQCMPFFHVKTLIINSKFDKQCFDADLNLWSMLFSDSANVSTCVYDDISHFGYKIDTSDPSSIYTRVDFPNELITAFADFVKSGKES